MDLLAPIKRIFAPLLKQPISLEGQVRPGPYTLPVTGGVLPDGVPVNWWQLGFTPLPLSPSAMVEACVSAYSQTVAMCPGDHWRANEKGGRDRVTNSALYRILRYPNAYQTMSDFLLNAIRSLYLEGNAYALALRNSRFEIIELHLMRSELSYPQLAYNGEIFYRLYGNDVIQRQLGNDIPVMVPARDVLHVRLHSSKSRIPYPLIGESPLVAALADILVSAAIAQQQTQFYLNQARPSAVLTTDLVLDKDQVQHLRDRWNEQSRGLNAGGTPILTAGLKPVPWNVPPRDAELAEMYKLTDQHIALAFRIPLQILGLAGPSYGSTEALMQAWIASGLGFCLNHVEEAFGTLFQLKGVPDEYVEFSTKALLRSAFKDRIDALVRGVQGGIFSPNEARNEEEMPSVKYGEEPRVQQQVVPLSQIEKMNQAPMIGGGPHIPGAPAPPAPPPSGTGGSEKDYAHELARVVRSIQHCARDYDRRSNAA